MRGAGAAAPGAAERCGAAQIACRGEVSPTGRFDLLTVKDKQRDEVERIAKVIALGRTACPNCQAPYQRGKFHRPYFICTNCGHRWSDDPVINALGAWLSELHERYPWDWFATLTFAHERFTRGRTVSRGDVTPHGAAYWFRRYLDEAGASGAAMPYAFRADEYGPVHGRYHLHALVGNVGHLRIYCDTLLPKGEWGKGCCWVHRWPCGIARIYPYDPQRGATYYLSKYVVKRLANWDFIGFEPENLVFRAEH